MTKLLKILFLAAVITFFTACITEEVVEYDLDCQWVDCPGADDTFEYASGGYYSFTCTWHCASYNGGSNQYVSLDFVSIDGSCLKLDSWYTSGGICY